MLPSRQSHWNLLCTEGEMRLHRAVAVVFVLAVAVSALAVPARSAFANSRADRMPVTSRSRQARKLFEQAMVSLEALQTEQALASWRAAVSKDPAFAQALALIAFLSTDPAEQSAVMARARALESHASDADRLLITWVSGVRNGDTVSAIAAMNDLLTMYPNDGRLAFLAGRWLLFRERYDQSAALLEHAVAQHPDYPAAINELAYAYAGNGRFRSAIVLMDRYVALEPSNPNPQDSYAEILRMQGDFPGALLHYRAALKLDPHFVSSVVGIADTLALMGEEQSARQQYSLAIAQAENESDRLQYQLQSAATFVREQRFVEADQAFRAAAQAAHEEGFALLAAEAFRMMGCYAPYVGSANEALAAAEQALAAPGISPGDRDEELARILRARAVRAARAGSGEPNPALDRLEKLAASSRSLLVQRSYAGALGAVLCLQLKFAEAIPHLEDDAGNPLSLELLAQAYEKAGVQASPSDLPRRAASFNQPTIEQALVSPSVQAAMRHSLARF
jgi:tetratricopeptide (TPR) repeat protein